MAFSPLLISYPVEILPYPIRAKGLTVSSFFVSATLVFNQYINPIALDHIQWKYYVRHFFALLQPQLTFFGSQIVYCVWLAFELAFCYFFIVETKGLTLEETAALFDGADAQERIVGHAINGADDVRIDEKAYDEKVEKA